METSVIKHRETTRHPRLCAVRAAARVTASIQTNSCFWPRRLEKNRSAPWTRKICKLKLGMDNTHTYTHVHCNAMQCNSCLNNPHERALEENSSCACSFWDSQVCARAEQRAFFVSLARARAGEKENRLVFNPNRGLIKIEIPQCQL